MNHHRLLEKLETWRKSYCFDRCNIYDGQWRPSSHRRVCSGDDPKHSQIDVDSDCRLLPTSQETAESMLPELKVLKQELKRPHPPSPQCDVPPRRPSARSPPQQQCYIPRVATAEETTVEEERAEQRMKNFLNALEERAASFTDEEFARFKCTMERKRRAAGRAAAPVIVALISAALANPPILDRVVRESRSI